MLWRRKTKRENVPWYRASNYRGNLGEQQKRLLDSFRMRRDHPAAKFEDLPGEVQTFIAALQVEAYDAKQERIFGQAFVVSGIGAASLFLSHYGFERADSFWQYLPGAFLLVVPWLAYSRQSRINAAEFIPRDDSAPTSTDELIRREWELDYILAQERKERGPDD